MGRLYMGGAENQRLQEEVAALYTENDRLRKMLKEREIRIRDLVQELKDLEERLQVFVIEWSDFGSGKIQ